VAGAADLERSCIGPFKATRSAGRIERLRVRMHGAAYGMHRHDTYAVGVTLSGVQSFWFRGERRTSLPGQTLVIHPDEKHDGGSGTDVPLEYLMLYFTPCDLTAESDSSEALPFVADAVRTSGPIRCIVGDAFVEFPCELDELAEVDILERLTTALRLEAGSANAIDRRIDWVAVTRARELLEQEYEHHITAGDLEAATGQGRYALARQFRTAYATTPHQFLIGRRMQRARRLIAEGASLAETAVTCGFADQSHLTRCFVRRLGLTPGAFRRNCVSGEIAVGGAVSRPPPARRAL
jgi:AraC-like DNA-binding protein